METKQDIIKFINKNIKYDGDPWGNIDECNELINWIGNLTPVVKPLIWHETEYGFVSEHSYYSIHFDAKAQGYFIKHDLQDLPDGFHTNVDRAKKACEYYYEQELLSRIEYV